MKYISGDEPAFPIGDRAIENINNGHYTGLGLNSYTPPVGLTIRQQFAMVAMQGLISKYGTDFQEYHAKEAVYMADALIAELNKTEP